jgi:hypothetical protein
MPAASGDGPAALDAVFAELRFVEVRRRVLVVPALDKVLPTPGPIFAASTALTLVESNAASVT